ERHGTAAAPHLARRDVDLQVGHAVQRGGESRAAPGQGLDPGHELAKSERLREIVVRSHFETAHPVVHGIERRQHQDRRGHALAAQLAAQLEPAPARGPPSANSCYGRPTLFLSAVNRGSLRIGSRIGPRERKIMLTDLSAYAESSHAKAASRSPRLAYSPAIASA